MSYTEHGDYLRILRIIYSKIVKDDNQFLANEQLVSINQSISLLDNNKEIDDEEKRNKNAILVKQDSDTSGQSGSNDLSKSTNLDKEMKENKEIDELKDESNDDELDKNEKVIKTNDCDSLILKLRDLCKDDKRQIYLTSKLFLCHRKNQTINDLKQEIQEWFKNYQLENASSKATRNQNASIPKILACETMQIFCKQNFMEMNSNDFTYLQKASEETFSMNR